jgi:hypothetical protein
MACPFSTAAWRDLNFFIQSVPFSTRLVRTDAGLRTETRWHHEYGGSTGPAFIAAHAAEFISDPVRACRVIFGPLITGVPGACRRYAGTGCVLPQ